MKSQKPAGESRGLEGVIVAAVTPRRAREHTIDLGATLELVDFLGERGVAGIALMGSTGEFVHFALDDRRHMVILAAKRSRVPLLVNVSHSTLDGAVELARAAAANVAGVLLMPPYYVRQSQESIRAFYLAFAAEIGETTPIYLYNIPACTTGIESSIAAELLSTGLFAGIKDSSGSLEYFQALHQQATKTPFTLLAGHERIYAQCRDLGAKGIVSGVASALPELMVSLDKALVAGERERSGQLQTMLAEFLQRVEVFPWPAGVKEAARRRGLKTGALAVPLGVEHQRKLTEFGEWFQGWLPQVLRECGK